MKSVILGSKKYNRMAKFFCKELGLQGCRIRIHRVRKKTLGHKDILATCGRRGPKNYIIEVVKPKKTEFEDFICTIIAHEFIHIEQYESGRLVDRKVNGENHVFWNGVDHGPDPDPGSPDIFTVPWEEEAFEKQEKLYERWVKR